MSEIHKKYLIASIILISMGIAMTSLMCADFSGRDLMQKYDVYQSGNYVVVEYKEDPKLFYFNERIYYSICALKKVKKLNAKRRLSCM